ncbi:MAG: nuclear transport factor 2 family protein [Chloroflexi bacterium]|nr:nuclear transport factor 2 family protein [Chloroflexota bacterium]
MSTKEIWEKYIKAFTDNYENAIMKFYTDDVLFETPKNRFEGRQAFIDYLNATRQGIREVLTPTNVFSDENRLAAELNAELHAYEDAPDFPEKPLKKGESISKSVSAFYDFKNGKISRVKIYHS